MIQKIDYHPVNFFPNSVYGFEGIIEWLTHGNHDF